MWSVKDGFLGISGRFLEQLFKEHNQRDASDIVWLFPKSLHNTF